MAKAAGRILKGNNVKLGDRFQLDTSEVAPTPTKGKDVASATPQVSIVENQPEFVVMEVTCSCGTKTYVRCEYAAAEYPAEGSQMSVDAQQHTGPDDTQNGASGNPDQEPDQKTEDSQMSVDAQQHTGPDDAQNGASGKPDQEPDQKIIGENENEN
jgi:hypothetical protein